MDKKIKVHYLFSRNEKIGSFIIRKSTAVFEPTVNETPSHVALLLDDKWVIESTLETGFRIIGYKKWLELNEELYKIPCEQEWTMVGIKEHYKPLKGKKYDYPGVLYFSWRVILYLLFRISKPKKNRFNHDNKYFCCEVISRMTGISYEMTAPVELLVRIKSAIEEFKKQ